MTTPAKYLVALSGTTIDHAWVEAADEATALAAAESLWAAKSCWLIPKSRTLETSVIIDTTETAQ